MSRTAKEKHVRVWQQSGAVTLFPAAAYEGITHALQSGAPFYEGEGLYGSTVFLRLASVTDVHFVTEAAMEAVKQDEAPSDTQPWDNPS